MPIESEVPLLDRPYAERQFIMVTDDAIVERIRLRRQLDEAEAKAGGKSKEAEDWATIAAMVVGLAFPVARVAALGIAGYEVVKRGIEAWGQASESVDIHLVAASEATATTFPPGHPKPDVLYIAHPAVSDRYCTTSDFHRMVFEHKFSEAVTMLMALGATAIEVHHVAGWTKEILGTMIAAFEGAEVGNAALHAGASSKNEESRSLILKADLGGGARREPYLPDNMVWYPHEQLWQTVAQGRLTHHLTRCQLAVNYADDFSVNAELHSAVSASKKGKAALSLGGSWNEYTSTVWRIDAVFGEDGSRLEDHRGDAAEVIEASPIREEA